MLVLRSLLFNVAFYVNIILWMIGLLPTFLLPRRFFMRGAQAWARSTLWLMRVIAGTRVEISGLERIPPGGLLVASKHQSLWETFAVLPLFDDPSFILKRELMWIPLFGWYTWKADCVPVNRKAGSQALIRMMTRAREEAAEGRQIVIFPEGTRRMPGAPPAYKFGITHLYQNLGVTCLPIALNSGLFWPRRQFIRRPGTIRVEILEPIPAGLPRDAFFKHLQETIEASTDRLVAEGRREVGLSKPGTGRPSAGQA